MKNPEIFIVLVCLFLAVQPSEAQESEAELPGVVYKTVDDTTRLSIYFTYPDRYEEKKRWPLIVFYHGGGWNGGSYRHFLRQARYFSERGFVCALPEYRVRREHSSTPFTSLKDAKSALRFLKGNVEQFRIDTSQVIASGGSAGGHLAAALDMVKGYNDSDDDLDISTRVDALVLFNPVLDNGPDGYGYKRVGERYVTFSPFHQDKKGTAPTIIFLGTEDNLIPVETMQKFCADMKLAGSTCRLVLFEGQEHGFFNRSPYMEKTMEEMREFLKELGYINN